MKKLLVALGFALASAGAQADGLLLDNVGSQTTNKPFDPVPQPAVVLPSGTKFLTGVLKATKEGIFQATFLGSESGYTNFYLGNSTIIEAGANVGTTDSLFVSGPSVIDFAFGTTGYEGNPGYTQENGEVNTPNIGIGYLLNDGKLFDILYDAEGNAYDFIMGFNDSYAAHRDFDDMVMGVRFVPTPVPAALPLLATGLALFGFSRRKSV